MFSFVLCHPFSTSLTRRAQKAIWACKFIHQIAHANQPVYFSDESLLEKLKELQQLGSDYVLEDEIKQKMLRLFQYRGLEQLSDDQHLHDKFHQEHEYFPNQILTTPVFRILLQPEKIQFIYGRQSIGKSSALKLFSHLSSYVSYFEFKKYYTTEYDKLFRNEMIFKIPKLIYWRLGFLKGCNQSQRESKAKQILLSQFIQFSQQYKEKLMSKELSEMIRNIRQCFEQKKISVRLIFDDLEDIEDMIRKYNYTQLSAKVECVIREEDQQALSHLKLIKQIRELGDSVVYCSQTDMISNIIEFLDLPSKKERSLDIHRSFWQQEWISPTQCFNNTWGQIVFMQYFWHFLQNQLDSSAKLSLSNKMRLKKELVNSAFICLINERNLQHAITNFIDIQEILILKNTQGRSLSAQLEQNKGENSQQITLSFIELKATNRFNEMNINFNLMMKTWKRQWQIQSSIILRFMNQLLKYIEMSKKRFDQKNFISISLNNIVSIIGKCSAHINPIQIEQIVNKKGIGGQILPLSVYSIQGQKLIEISTSIATLKLLLIKINKKSL